MWELWMRRALALAALAEGHTSPNPLVGALVLDREGRLAGEGFHARAGDAHAEVGALRQAGDCLLYTSPSPRDRQKSRMPSSA